MTDPKATVTAFLAALERLDIDAALALAAADITYQNVPLHPARGINAVDKQLRSMLRHCTGFEARISHLAADGPVVLTERVDVLTFRGVAAEFWVCGTFEVRDGRIVLWRDYFDWGTFLMGCVRGLGRALLKSNRRSKETRLWNFAPSVRSPSRSPRSTCSCSARPRWAPGLSRRSPRPNSPATG